MLKKELGRNNVNSLPKLEKVTVSIGFGSYMEGQKKDFAFIEEMLSSVAGQKPVLRKAKKAISNFKLREGLPVGLFSTLRGQRMYDFVARLVNVALPRVRDFRGISAKGFDGQGNFNIGIRDCTIFPEVDPDKLSKGFGLQITIVSSSRNDQEAFMLFKALGFPFRDEVKVKGKGKGKGKTSKK